MIKQTDGCPMGAPISKVFSDIYMCKMEDDIKALKPIFYKSYVDDACIKRKCNKAATLSDVLNSFHPNVKFILEQNPTRLFEE